MVTHRLLKVNPHGIDGQRRRCAGCRGNSRRFPAYPPVVWETTYEEPLYLVTNMVDLEAAIAPYRKRAHIETFFSDQKSRGFHIHKSHLSAPERLTRLLIASCLAYVWLVYLGVCAVRRLAQTSSSTGSVQPRHMMCPA